MSSPTRTITSQMASSPFSNTNSIWSGTGSKERQLSGPTFSTGSFSRGSFSRGSFSNHTVFKAELNQLISGCAISDDEVDGAENINALGAEDFLPSSLSDLLTPQELKRKTQSLVVEPTYAISSMLHYSEDKTRLELVSKKTHNFGSIIDRHT